MGLRLGGARADDVPRDEVADVLGHEDVEQFRAGGQADFRHAEQEMPRHADAFLDVEGVVHVGIVDESLPADGGTRLLEVDAHDDEDGIGDFIGERGLQIFVGVKPQDPTGADRELVERPLQLRDWWLAVSYSHRYRAAVDALHGAPFGAAAR